MKFLIVNVTYQTMQGRVSDTIRHVTLKTINSLAFWTTPRTKQSQILKTRYHGELINMPNLSAPPSSPLTIKKQHEPSLHLCYSEGVPTQPQVLHAIRFQQRMVM